MKKMSTETAGNEFWSKIELIQNSNKIDAISWINETNYFIEWKYGIETSFNWKKNNKYLLLKQLVCSPLINQKRGDLFVFCQNSNALREALVFS